MGKAMTLTADEAEFVQEMLSEHRGEPGQWMNFDPVFARSAVRRFLNKGWIEERGSGRQIEYSWTEKGLAADPQALLTPDENPVSSPTP